MHAGTISRSKSARIASIGSPFSGPCAGSASVNSPGFTGGSTGYRSTCVKNSATQSIAWCPYLSKLFWCHFQQKSPGCTVNSYPFPRPPIARPHRRATSSLHQTAPRPPLALSSREIADSRRKRSVRDNAPAPRSIPVQRSSAPSTTAVRSLPARSASHWSDEYQTVVRRVRPQFERQLAREPRHQGIAPGRPE